MRAERLLSLLILLQAHGSMTTQALARKLEVSRRTILRDIDALSLAGIPITAQGGHGGGVFLDKSYRVSLTGLDVSEMHALLAAGPSGPLKELGLEKAAEKVILKLVAAFPVRQQEQLAYFRQRMHFDPVWWQQDGKVTPFLAILQGAVLEDRCLRIRYERHSGESSERRVEAYGLVAKGSTWYLVARREGEWRTYRVSRLQQVEQLEEVFQRDQTFDLAAYWREQSVAFEKQLPQFSCTLQIQAGHLYLLNWYAEGQFRLSEVGEQEQNSWCTVYLTVSSLQSACGFVLRAGPYVRVVEPSELRAEVVRVAQQVVECQLQK